MLLDYPLELNSNEEEMFQKTLSLLKIVHFFTTAFILGKRRIVAKL